MENWFVVLVVGLVERNSDSILVVLALVVLEWKCCCGCRLLA